MIIIGAIIAAHAFLAVMIARWTFGHVRARILDSEQTWHEWSTGARIQGAGIVLTLVCIAGLWPILLLTGLVMARPPLTAYEMQDMVAARDKRVAELERQLGIKP